MSFEKTRIGSLSRKKRRKTVSVFGSLNLEIGDVQRLSREQQNGGFWRPALRPNDKILNVGYKNSEMDKLECYRLGCVRLV